MTDFLSAFIFILPGLMAYFWLQAFGLTPSVKHTAPELSGIASLLWVPISFVTIIILNLWGAIIHPSVFDVDTVWTVEAFNTATSDIRYLFLFIFLSFLVSFFLCKAWSLYGHEKLRNSINRVRGSRNIGPLSSSTTVWEEFFIKIDEENNTSKDEGFKGKEAVYRIYKIDKPEEFVVGSMTKVSRPFEVDKSIVLADTQEWKDSLVDYEYKVKQTYVDVKAGIVVEELDHKKPIDKQLLLKKIL